jgi:hypothetical protein
MDAPGVAYYEISGADGRYFRCDRYRCGLSTKTCAKRWKIARTAVGYDLERVEHCRGCPIGAAHSGQRAEHYSPLYQLGICPRCRRGGARMILRDCVCISDFNRAREVRVGANSKGTPPRKCHLAPHRMTAVINGLPFDIRNPEGGDQIELVLGLLGNVPGRMYFTRARRNPATTISTQQLAAMHRRAMPGQPRVSPARQQQRTTVANEAKRAQSAAVALAPEAVAASIEHRAAGIAAPRQEMTREARG